MVIFRDLSWATDSTNPDGNFIHPDNRRQPKWVISDNSEVASKVMSTMRPWTPVEDENGKLIDIIETPLSQEEINRQRIGEIKRQLAELDAQAIRPLRAVAAGTATDADTDNLREIETQAEILRAELAELGGGD